MKVKVRRIVAPYQDVPTTSLQAILANHAHNRLRVMIGLRQLYEIMNELVRRREIAGTPFQTNEEAWAAFAQFYMGNALDPLIDPTGTRLTPSFHGKDCLGNGKHPGIECCCDNCDYFLDCFPEFD